MAEASRDQNRATVALAYDGTTTKQLVVDSVTGRLLVEAVASSSGGSINSAPAKRDQNRVPVCLAVTDDANQTVVPIATDSDGYLLCDSD